MYFDQFFIIKENNQNGFTLIELVIAIAIAGVVFTGVMFASSYLIKNSADPILRQQSIFIAESFIEEIQSKAFARVDAPPADNCPDVPGVDTRSNYSHVCHFHDFSQTGIEDQTETSIAGLENYSVSITVEDSNNLGPTGSKLSSTVAVIVSVVVTSPDNQTLRMSMYRTDV